MTLHVRLSGFMYVYSYSTSVPLLCSGIVPFRSATTTMRLLFRNQRPVYDLDILRSISRWSSAASTAWQIWPASAQSMPYSRRICMLLGSSWARERCFLPLKISNDVQKIENPRSVLVYPSARRTYISRSYCFSLRVGLISSSVSPYLLTYPGSVPWRLLSGYQWISRLRRHTCFSEPSLQDDIVILHAWLSHPS